MAALKGTRLNLDRCSGEYCTKIWEDNVPTYNKG